MTTMTNDYVETNQFTSSMRAITLGFGNLFNRIQIIRYNDDGSENTRFLVPIQYANKEKYIARLQGDPNLDRNVQITLPAMSFEMTGISYDATRKQNTNVKNFTGGNGTVRAFYNPVPYNFDFQLYIYTRNEEDGVQIIERILPFFSPDYTIKVNVLPDIGIVREIPILLTGTNYESGYEGGMDSELRTIIWTLNFTAKGYMFVSPAGPASLIKTAITNIITDINYGDSVVFAMTQPGIGQYQVGELVYQGYSLGTAVATAKVVDFSNGNLYLTQLTGNFVTGSPIIGATTNANYLFSSYTNMGPVPIVQSTIEVTSNPTSANVGSLYTYTSAIQEGNGAPIVVTSNANNQIIFAPQPPPPYIFNEYDLML
jgi:hypothetical protein